MSMVQCTCNMTAELPESGPTDEDTGMGFIGEIMFNSTSEARLAARNEIADIVSHSARNRPSLTRQMLKLGSWHGAAFRADGAFCDLPELAAEKPLGSTEGTSVACTAAGADASSGGNSMPLVMLVINAESVEQATECAQEAIKRNADGIILTNESFDYPQLLPIIRSLRRLLPNIPLGVKFLRLGIAEAFATLGKLACEGVFVDVCLSQDTKIDIKAQVQTSCDNIYQSYVSSGWSGHYFGGVAWPNQREKSSVDDAELPDDKLENAAQLGAKYADVVCTCIKEMAQLQAMRRGCGETPFAVVLEMDAGESAPPQGGMLSGVADIIILAASAGRGFKEIGEGLSASIASLKAQS